MSLKIKTSLFDKRSLEKRDQEMTLHLNPLLQQ